jgi:aspartate racemase
MRTIGLLGGMSWESSALYYRLINEGVRDRLGGYHSASCVLASVDFDEIEALQRSAEWHRAGEILADRARQLEAAGADCVVLCTNTMHKVAEQITEAVGIPMLHVVDLTAAAIRATGATTVGLLGTRFTMEEPFYRDRMAMHGITVRVPDDAERTIVHDIIYNELVRGVVREESRAALRAIIAGLVETGAEGIVLGCTEIELLISGEDAEVAVFPTTTLHAAAAVDFALG